MPVRFHSHARERMEERGATEDEVTATVEHGEQFPAKFGRTGFRRNFPYGHHTLLLNRQSEGRAMRFTYDPRYNIAYIRFQEKRADVETIRISDELVVDMAPNGTVYGIELLNANEQLGREDSGKLLLINEATNDRAELPLAVS